MKPATPLPWRLREHPALGCFIEAPRANGMPYGLDVCGEDYTGYGDDEARAQNMRFIVHAAVAYPRLVEFLQSIDAVDHNLHERAQALLGDLGEAK